MRTTLTISILVLIIMTGCATAREAPASSDGPMSTLSVAEKVEVYHFHGTSQCVSCIAVGDLAEKTVNAYFADEVAEGKVVFAHVNGELAENRALVTQYGATGSSLWIGTYIDGQFHKEQNMNVWYKIKDEDDYMTYLKGVLDKRLAGDLS